MSDQRLHCINCGIASWRRNPSIGLHQIEEESILSVIQQWVAPQVVNRSHHICQGCRDLAMRPSGADEQLSIPTTGHCQVCVNCGRSVLRARSHLLRTDIERERRIHTVISEWILPRTISRARALICHSCWVRADRNAHHYLARPSGSSGSVNVTSGHGELTPQCPPPPRPTSQASQATSQFTPRVSDSIILPDYVRAVDTESQCFIEGCRRQERNRVPVTIRKMLLDHYKFYIPKNNRLCDHHLKIQSWDFLTGILENYINVFTALHIQDMLELKSHSNTGLNFIDIQNMEDHLVHHWLGFTKEQYQRILNEVPQLLLKSSGPIGLTAYLMKLRTSDSNERISALFNIPKRTLDGYVSEARHLMYDYFVPRHLGLNHMNRQEIVDRTLLIPQGLFGNHNGVNKPVIIIDGTYCFIEKSSNYLYQKRTYSLHKYNNLVKPFMIVCADGHIVDVMGPYPATTSDAEIINHEFRDPNSILRQYFQAGDAFVLDRGFRDALPLLHECGYRTYVPPTLQEGEWQHSTLEANKSRAVTIYQMGC
ncbi:uncharacterized protein LOC125075621 [Vanessa atalanta]|uniref:uncharacterized protein LOC125075621 n=1 Tax=Vanessa atalanta TaxID=42275 RepID=UPI001FCD1104|nr:uncharacterized protein LOC125075621 [Vanessa atalanta]